MTPLNPFDIKCKKLKRKKKGGGAGSMPPDTLKFCGSCYNIIFKPYATSKMGFFVAEITVADCCYIELRYNCDRVPRSDLKCIDLDQGNREFCLPLTCDSQ